MPAESQPIHGQWAVLPVPGKRPKMISTTWPFAPRGDRRGGPDRAGALTALDGDKKIGRAAYQEFLTVRKNADRDVPILNLVNRADIRIVQRA
jgi:hypothetical protein